MAGNRLHDFAMQAMEETIPLIVNCAENSLLILVHVPSSWFFYIQFDAFQATKFEEGRLANCITKVLPCRVSVCEACL